MFNGSGDFYKGMFADDKMDGFGTFYDAKNQELYLG